MCPSREGRALLFPHFGSSQWPDADMVMKFHSPHDETNNLQERKNPVTLEHRTQSFVKKRSSMYILFQPLVLCFCSVRLKPSVTQSSFNGGPRGSGQESLCARSLAWPWGSLLAIQPLILLSILREIMGASNILLSPLKKKK